MPFVGLNTFCVDQTPLWRETCLPHTKCHEFRVMGGGGGDDGGVCMCVVMVMVVVVVVFACVW